jgi:hypothetical protein
MSEIDDIIKETLDHLEDQIQKLDEKRKIVREDKLRAKIFEIETCNGFLKCTDGSWVQIQNVDAFCTHKTDEDDYRICGWVKDKSRYIFAHFATREEAQACLDTLVKNLYNDEE